MPVGDFSEQAEAYRRSRPGYPESLLDLAVCEAGIGPGAGVVEFGAGTGILTEMLIRRRFEVTAVDPNEDMMRQADVPGARWIRSTFEHNPLPDESQDWAVAAQAFHWADRSAVSLRSLVCPLQELNMGRERSVVCGRNKRGSPCTQ